MSYITPNTTIYMCSNVPLDSTYVHSIYWSSLTEQLAYFKSKIAYTLTSYTYQRVNNNVIRISGNANEYYTCNYMLFQNTAYGSRYFFAFIDRVSYINDNTTEVYYTLDHVQTWFFDYELQVCWIERETTASDIIGINRQPEPLTITDYGCAMGWERIMPTSLSVVVLISDVDIWETYRENDPTINIPNDVRVGAFYYNVYSGSVAFAFSNDDEGQVALNDLIEEYYQDEDAIIAMYMCPTWILPESYELNSGAPITNNDSSYMNVVYDALTSDDTLGWEWYNEAGYTPRNCKLYTYPYNYGIVIDTNGNSLICPYEYFDEGKPQFILNGIFTQPVEVRLYPTGYLGSGDYVTLSGYRRAYTQGLTLTDYPLCSWSYDAFKAWLAQNATPLLISTIGSLAQTTMNVASMGLYSDLVTMANGAPITSASFQEGVLAEIIPTEKIKGLTTTGKAATYKLSSSLSGTLASLASQIYSASIVADPCRGSFSNGGADIAGNYKSFYFSRFSIDAYTAERFDTFFDMYGYAVNRRGVPPMNNRDFWTYCKTSGCQIKGSIPNEATQLICSVFDKGITWWNGANSDYILDYSQDNRATVRGA